MNEILSCQKQLRSGGVLAIATLELLFSTVVAASGLQEASPLPSGEWNSTSLRVTFDGVMLDEGHHLLLYYVLNNTTDADYQLKDGSNVTAMLKLRGQLHRGRELSAADLTVFYPIFVPSRQRQIVVAKYRGRIYDFGSQLKLHASPKEEQAFQKELKAFVRRHSPEVVGFVLFDRASRYRIDLPWNF